jgi:hypothetical protein
MVQIDHNTNDQHGKFKTGGYDGSGIELDRSYVEANLRVQPQSQTLRGIEKEGKIIPNDEVQNPMTEHQQANDKGLFFIFIKQKIDCSKEQ